MKVKLKNKEDESEFTLLFAKEYEVENIEDGYYRIIDEDSDDEEEPKGYLYSTELFEVLQD